MSLDSIVQVQISTQTQAVAEAGFGTPLILAYHNVWPELVRQYSSTADMVSDGFAADSPAVLAASAIKAQNPQIVDFKIGRRALAFTQTEKITPVAQDSTTYTLTINGTDFVYVSDATATIAEITLGLTTAVNGGSEPVTATDNSTDLDLTADNAGELFSLEMSWDGSDRLLLRQNLTTDPGIATDLAAVLLADPDWYGLVIDSQSKAEIEAASAWVETNKRLFVAACADTDILTASTTDLFSVLQSFAYARTAAIWSARPHQYSGAAWIGNRFPSDPGSSTWNLKTLAGVQTDDLTTNEIANIDGKGGNWYTRIAGVNVTQVGRTSSGEWIDVTRFVDWLAARLQERIFSRLVNLEKVPYTAGGIALIESEIRAQLQEGIAAGGLRADPEPTVETPDLSAIPTNDKINRLLPDVSFLAYLAGAIHNIQIAGVVV